MDIKKLYQMFILGTDNPVPAIKNGLGGIIFFTKDIQSVEQIKELIYFLLKIGKKLEHHLEIPFSIIIWLLIKGQKPMI